MNVHDIQNEDGELFAFEVDNCWLGRRAVRRIVRTIPGATLVAFRRFAEEFCDFELDGIRFVAWEPWNDNSRYWIGTKPPRVVPQLSIVRDAFVSAQGPFRFLKRIRRG